MPTRFTTLAASRKPLLGSIQPIKNGFGCDALLDLAQLTTVLDRDIQMSSNSYDHLGEFRQFVFGEQINVEVKIGTLVGRRRGPVLTDQHKR